MYLSGGAVNLSISNAHVLDTEQYSTLLKQRKCLKRLGLRIVVNTGQGQKESPPRPERPHSHLTVEQWTWSPGTSILHPPRVV
jgi:hypothetical protein